MFYDKRHMHQILYYSVIFNQFILRYLIIHNIYTAMNLFFTLGGVVLKSVGGLTSLYF